MFLYEKNEKKGKCEMKKWHDNNIVTKHTVN